MIFNLFQDAPDNPWVKQDTTDSRVMVVIVIILAAVLIIVSLVRWIQNGAKIPSLQPMLNHGAFKRQATSTGFTKSEMLFLEDYAKKLGVINPQTIFGNAASLDSFLKNAYKYIEKNAKTEADAEAQKSDLFSLREILGRRIRSGASMKSTRSLEKLMPLSLVNAQEAHFPTVLVANQPDALYVEAPRDAFGEYIHFTRSAKLNVFFYTGNHAGYQFKTRTGSTVETNGRSLLALSHSDDVTPLPSRNHDRTQTRIPCRYFLVHVLTSGNGRNATKTVKTEKAAISSLIVDISAGGMSMQTSSPVSAGDIIKIEFEIGRGMKAVFGTVIRVNRMKNGFAMHIRIIKIAPKTRNEILAYVYNYL